MGYGCFCQRLLNWGLVDAKLGQEADTKDLIIITGTVSPDKIIGDKLVENGRTQS